MYLKNNTDTGQPAQSVQPDAFTLGKFSECQRTYVRHDSSSRMPQNLPYLYSKILIYCKNISKIKALNIHVINGKWKPLG